MYAGTNGCASAAPSLVTSNTPSSKNMSFSSSPLNSSYQLQSPMEVGSVATSPPHVPRNEMAISQPRLNRAVALRIEAEKKLKARRHLRAMAPPTSSTSPVPKLPSQHLQQHHYQYKPDSCNKNLFSTVTSISSGDLMPKQLKHRNQQILRPNSKNSVSMSRNSDITSLDIEEEQNQRIAAEREVERLNLILQKEQERTRRIMAEREVERLKKLVQAQQEQQNNPVRPLSIPFISSDTSSSISSLKQASASNSADISLPRSLPDSNRWSDMLVPRSSVPPPLEMPDTATIQCNQDGSTENPRQRSRSKKKKEEASYHIVLRARGKGVLKIPGDVNIQSIMNTADPLPLTVAGPCDPDGEEVVFTSRDGISLGGYRSINSSERKEFFEEDGYNPTLFQFGNHFLAADPVDPRAPVLLRVLPISAKSRSRSAGVSARYSGKCVARNPSVASQPSPSKTLSVAGNGENNHLDASFNSLLDISKSLGHSGSPMVVPRRSRSMTDFFKRNYTGAATSIPPEGADVNPLISQLRLTDAPNDEFSQQIDDYCVLSRVWDVRYEGQGTVRLRSVAHPNYWLAQDPITNTLRLLPTEAKSEKSLFNLYCLAS